MPTITVTARQGAPEETSADTRVVGLFEGESPPAGAVADLVESGEAKAKPRKVAVTHEDGGRRLLVVGLGKREEFDAEAGRIAGGAAAQRARELGTRSLSWALPDGEGAGGGIVEGTLLALYKFDAYKSKKDDEDGANGIESLEIAAGHDAGVQV
jgi:leucyl aminopeptidase